LTVFFVPRAEGGEESILKKISGRLQEPPSVEPTASA
jgi:hypothetical protein